MILSLLATSLGGARTVKADSALELQANSFAIVFVSRKIPPNGSAYYNQTGSMPGVQPWGRFQVSAPGKLIVREANGTLRTLVDGSNPTAASLNLIDVNAPEVSYDATRIVFAGLPSGSYSTGPMTTPGAWRIYVINVDGTGLRQLTFSDRNINLSQFGSVAGNFNGYDDFDPVWLPDGRIVFASTRWPSFGQYGAALTSNLHVMNADGSNMHRITAERNGAERPLVDPLTGKIIYSRWWRNFRLGTNSMANQTAPEGGFIIKDGICALSRQGAECQEAAGLTSLERNAWHLASINPDGTGLAQFAGRSNTFVVGELINHAYGGAFAPNGDLYANFFPMTNGTEAAGFGGIRLYKRGANGYTPIIGITTRDEDVQQFARTNPNSYGVYVGNYAGEPEVMPNGQLIISWAQDVRQDYGLYTIDANGGNRALIYDNPGTTELRARLIRVRPVPPIIPDKVTRVASLLPPSAQGPYDIDGTFTFNALNVYFNAPVDVDIQSAPPVGSANTIRFFVDHQRNQQRGSFETLDWPILLQEVVINPNGSVAANLPANVPLFEQLRSAQPGYKIPLTGRAYSPNETSGAAHVAGMNYGRTGDVSSCVGCHAGHTLIPVPSAADALWTNLAPGANVTYSSLSSSLSDGDGLVDRRVNLLRAYDNHKRFWQSRSGQNPNQQWVQLAFPVPITIRTVRLYNIPSSESNIQVQQATVRLYSDAAGTVEVANLQSGPLSSNGTNVQFPEVFARVVRIEFNSVNGSAAGLAEVEVIARAESGNANPGPTATAGPPVTSTAVPSVTATSTTVGSTPPPATNTTVPPATSTPAAVDSFTKALLPMDGSDGSTSFIDSAGKIWTVIGNSQIDTAQSKFGGASGLFDANGDYVQSADHTDFDLTGDFTIDFWVQHNGLNGYQTYLSRGDGNTGNAYLMIRKDNANRLDAFIRDSNGALIGRIQPANTLSANTWYHIAYVRSGGNFYLFLNGSLAGSATSSAAGADTNYVLQVGKHPQNVDYMAGWLDELRISKGVARWTTNFTPPTAPYGGGSNPVPTNTPVPTSTSIPLSTATATQVPSTAVASPTSIVFTATNTSVPVWTATNMPTAIPSNTPAPTLTALPTNTAISNPTSVPPVGGVLDTFNRANGRIGKDWSGETSRYRILSNQLDVRGVGAILWKAQSFGKDQEVFVTLAKVDPFGREINLLLKAQSPTNWGDGVIEVSYNAIDDHVQILTYTFAQDWKQCGANIPVTFVDGDKFGAKAKADGTVEVYRNGSLIGSCNVSASYPHFANGGYIGLWFLDASNSVADDFGGGTITP